MTQEVELQSEVDSKPKSLIDFFCFKSLAEIERELFKWNDPVVRGTVPLNVTYRIRVIALAICKQLMKDVMAFNDATHFEDTVPVIKLTSKLLPKKFAL